MTREGARGMEWNAWSTGIDPAHHEILPYTRLLAGPMDYTPGVFDIEYRSIEGDPRLKVWNGLSATECRVPTTLAKQIANWVVLYSPLQMACDLVDNYEGHPAFQFFRDFDADCDWSKALQGEIGEYISVVRRAGDRYFYGATTDATGRTLTEKLDFLQPGIRYHATIYADAPDTDWQTNPYAYVITEREVTDDDTLEVVLAPGGGQAITFIPVSH
jgi:alpha-glucosidase